VKVSAPGTAQVEDVLPRDSTDGEILKVFHQGMPEVCAGRGAAERRLLKVGS
jgi:hypothetical protein